MAQKEAEIILFGLESGEDLRIEYPELAQIDEFKNLKAKEVRLCWLLGNRTSPLYKLSDKRERLNRALEIVYGKSYIQQKQLKALVDGDIPVEIKEAIKKMEEFNPEYRLRAKLLSEYMFETLNEMVVVGSNELATMEVDEKKKYTDLLVKIHEELPDMVKRLETSYGVKVKDRKTKKEILVKINDVLRWVTCSAKIE